MTAGRRGLCCRNYSCRTEGQAGGQQEPAHPNELTPDPAPDPIARAQGALPLAVGVLVDDLGGGKGRLEPVRLPPVNRAEAGTRRSIGPIRRRHSFAMLHRRSPLRPGRRNRAEPAGRGRVAYMKIAQTT